MNKKKKQEKQFFIKTSDKATAEYLRSAGFPELAKEGDRFVFVNDQSKKDFAANVSKASYTDVLTF